MNYSRYYTLLILRGKSRNLTGYKERHHILPRYCGGDNSPENLVDLTAREHYLAHLLWANMTGDAKAWFAVGRMSGGIRGRLNSKLYEVAKLKSLPMLSAAGLKVGPVTGEMMRVQKRGVCARTLEQLQEQGRVYGPKGGKIGGAKVRDLKLGVHSLTKEQLSECGKLGSATIREMGVGIFNQANYTPEQNELRRLGGVRGAKTIVENKLGIHGWTTEQRSERAKRQNHAAGKSTSSQVWKCCECDMQSTPGALARHHMKSGHVGKVRVR